MKIRALALNDCGILNGKRFIVINRASEDRASGSTDVLFEDGCEETFVWDFRDPEVAYLGKGSTKREIVWPDALAALKRFDET
jgi:hypothetical protein